jgi:hypothetical protein
MPQVLDVPRSELRYPLWILIHRGESPWRPVMLVPGYLAAFSDHERAAAFMAERGDPRWEFRLVVRPTLQRIADQLRRCGARGVQLDPDGSGTGAAIDFDESGFGEPQKLTSGSGVVRAYQGRVAPQPRCRIRA